jgi:uncharacterized membrane protein
MSVCSDASIALNRLAGLRTNPLVDATLRDRLDHLRRQRERLGYDNGSPDWLPLYHDVLDVANELLASLKNQELESSEASHEAENSAQNSRDIDDLSRILKRFTDQFQTAISTVNIRVTQAEYDAVADIDKLLQGVKITTSLKQGFTTVTVPDAEKRRINSRANAIIQRCTASAAQSLDRFFQSESRSQMSVISRDCLQLQIAGANRLKENFRHRYRQLQLLENQQSFEVPSLWKLSLLSGRQVISSIMMLGLIGAGVLSLILGKGNQKVGRGDVVVLLIMIALPIFIIFIFTSLRKRRDRQVVENKDRAKKTLINDYSNKIKSHLNVCRESFKGDLNLFQNRYMGAIKDLRESVDMLRTRHTSNLGATMIGRKIQTAASRTQLMEKLQSEIIPQIKHRILEKSPAVDEFVPQAEKISTAGAGFPVIKLSLWISNNADGIELDVNDSLDGGKEYSLKQNDEIHLNIETNRIVHLFIVNLDQDESCQVVFPNGYHPKETIMGFKRHVIPGHKYPFRWRIMGTGSNRIMAFASTKDIWPTEPRHVDSFLQLEAEECRKLFEELNRRIARLENHQVTQATIHYKVSS